MTEIYHHLRLQKRTEMGHQKCKLHFPFVIVIWQFLPEEQKDVCLKWRELIL